MAELKTKINDASVDAFLADVADADKRAFARRVAAMMGESTGDAPRMWGSSIVGFGRYTFHYASGRSGDWMRIGFSPRKSAMTLYIMPGFSEYEDLLSRLGKYKTGKSCLYVKRESDIDLEVLRELIDASLAAMAKQYPEGAAKKKTAAKSRV